MALIEEFERSGNWLFKRRSWIPVLLFIPATGVILTGQPEWLPFTNLYWALGCLLVSFAGLGIRIWAIGHTPKGTSGRNTKEGQIAEKLNTTGVYSLVRHPLYLGNFLMWLGVILYTGHTLLLVAVVAFFWLYYERIMFAEEAFIRKKFGAEYARWANVTPPFIPRFNGYIQPELPFSLKNVMKREYTGFTLTILCFSLVNLMKHTAATGQAAMDPIWLALLPIALALYFILRSVKKHSNLLHVEGR
jgi:protein-S-isoprenylcysteine O-methyltransferase Ste14